MFDLLFGSAPTFHVVKPRVGPIAQGQGQWNRWLIYLIIALLIAGLGLVALADVRGIVSGTGWSEGQ